MSDTINKAAAPDSVDDEGEDSGRGVAVLFDLRRDLDDPDQIDANVRDGVGVAGTNLWVLFFAILVASVGLNVNSTAVILGAMLISPLMGPILGLGYGLAVQDMRLIRRALRNLLIFTAISLVTSTLYFAISPLRELGTELMARTSPNLWDVLIAFFGGSAGIIALTRRSISNVVPGVAIATALMPPLCTVGFSIARGNWNHAGGALYLFVINGVFIAFATFVFVKLIRLPLRGAVSQRTRMGARLLTTLTVLGVLLPSTYLAWRFVDEQRFVRTANDLLATFNHDERFIVLDREIDPSTRRLALTLSGDPQNPALERELTARLAEAGYADSRIQLRFSGGQALDVGSLKSELQAGVLSQLSRESEGLRAQLRTAQTQNAALRAATPDFAQLIRELQAQLPQASEIAIGVGALAPQTADAASAPPAVTLVRVIQRTPLPKSERERIERWLAVRLPERAVRLSYEKEL